MSVDGKTRDSVGSEAPATHGSNDYLQRQLAAVQSDAKATGELVRKIQGLRSAKSRVTPDGRGWFMLAENRANFSGHAL